MAQVCSPRWYSANAIASSAASTDFGSTPSRGGSPKCEIGSATPQNMSTVPIPAANSMANQDRLLYSGFESCAPRRTLPYLLSAIQIRNASIAVTLKMKNQLRLVTTQPLAAVAPRSS